MLTLPFAAAALAVGILLGWILPLGPAPWLVLAAAGWIPCLLTLRRRILGAILPLLPLLLAGAALSAPLGRPSPAACHVSGRTGHRPVRLTATAAGAALADATGQRQLVSAHLLQGDGAPVPVCGLVELRRDPGVLPLEPGERVLVRGRLRPAVAGRNPGAAGGALSLLARGVGARMRAAKGDLVRLSTRPTPLVDRIRRRVTDLAGEAISDPQQRAVVLALAVGRRQGISPEQRLRFAQAGLSHLLAISGLHLSMVALGLLGLTRRLLLRWPALSAHREVRRPAALVAAAAALAYTLLAGAAPPTVRACVMVCCCCLAHLSSRPPDLLRPLSLAAILLLLWQPVNLLRPGFQLSFAAVLGIFVLARRGAEEPLGPRPTGLRARAWRWTRGLVLTSLAATLCTGPLVAQHFGQVSAAGLVTNLLAIPWTGLLLLPATLLGSAVGLLSPALGLPLLQLAGWAAGWLDALSRLAAASPTHLMVPAPGWAVTLGLVAAAVALLGRGRLRRLCLAAGLLLLLGAGVQGALRQLSPGLELVFLDVGQGDSTFARFPDGTTLLVDAGGGPTGDHDSGRRRVLPALRALGVRRLDLVVASHPHPDHVAGLPAVLESLEVGELWLCWHDAEETPNPWHRALLRVSRRRGIPVRRPRELRRGGVLLTPLWPRGFEGACADPGHSANNNSVVLRLEFGRAAALLPGDIEGPVEERLLASPRSRRRLRVDLLKAPHHGSETSSSADFLEAAAPRLAVISCGLDNSFGIPPPAVVERYRRRRIPLARVDLQGAIGVRLGADGAMAWGPLTGPGAWTRTLPPEPEPRTIDPK